MSRSTFVDLSNYVEQINVFNNAESDSEDNDDNGDDDDPELLKAIEAEVKSRLLSGRKRWRERANNGKRYSAKRRIVQW